MDRKRKERVFVENYKIYKDKIYTYFLYRVNFDKEIAEDLTSEVFLKAYAHIESFDPERSFQAWIYTISRNHLFNHYRTAGREVELEQADCVAVEFSKAFETQAELEKAINEIYKLDNYCREVLLLRFVEGLDNREIAEVLDKDEGAIRVQISRALSALRNNLNEKYDK